MFAAEVKDSQSELSVSVSSLDDLQLDDVIASDGCAAVFTAKIRPHRPGILGHSLVQVCQMHLIVIVKTICNAHKVNA